MKILHVIASLAPRYGGPSKACPEMARALATLGHTVSIYTTNVDGPGELAVPTDRAVFQQGVEVRYFPIQPPRFWMTSWPLARALGKKIPQSDIVHIHSLYFFHSLVTGFLCRKFEVPYLIRPHGTLDPFIYRRHRLRKTVMELLFENRNIRKAAALHFTTAEERDLAAPVTFGTPGVIVPLGLDLQEYKALPELGTFRRNHPEIGDKKIILFFGRLNFKKGLDILIRSFGIVARKRDDVHLVLTGPDNDGWGEKIESWLRAEGVSGRATLTGMLLGQEKLAVLRDAEFFVLPSYSENFGVAVIEAMACGLPVIISDKVNIYQELKQYNAGKVVPCDVKETAQAMLELLGNPELGRRMGQNGIKMVEEQYRWDKVAYKLEEIYKEILANRKAT